MGGGGEIASASCVAIDIVLADSGSQDVPGKLQRLLQGVLAFDIDLLEKQLLNVAGAFYYGDGEKSEGKKA